MVQERKTYSKLPSSSKKSYGSRFNPNSEHVASTQEKKSRFARETKQNGPNTYLGSNTPSSTGSANEQPKKRESGNSATLSRNPDRETDTRRNRTNLSSSYRPSASNNASAEVPPVTRLSKRSASTTQGSTADLSLLPKEPSALRKKNVPVSLLEYTKLSKQRGNKDNVSDIRLRAKKEKTFHVYSRKLVTHCLMKSADRRRTKWGRNSRPVNSSSELPYVLDVDASSQFLAYINSDRKLLIGELTASMETLNKIDEKGSSLVKYGTAAPLRGFSWSRRYPGVFAVLTTEQTFGKQKKHFIKLIEKTSFNGLQLLKSIELEHSPSDCLFSPDNKYLVVLSGNHRLIFYSSDLEILHQSINLSEKCTSLNWHPSGKMLHVGTPDGECLIYSEEASAGWALKTTLDISHSAVTSIVCDTRGQLILFASSDGNLQVFSLENYTKINSFESENGYAILSLDLSNDSQVVYISYVDEDTKEVYVCFYHWPTNTNIYEKRNITFAKSLHQKIGFLSVSQGGVYSNIP